MKILHAHMALNNGGIESMIVGLANEMAKYHQVDILTIFEPGDNDICINRLDLSIKKHTLGKKSPGISPKYILDMAKFIRIGKYDIVNIHGFFYYNFLSVILNHNRTKYFYTVHSDAVMENDNWDEKLKWLKKFCFKKKWMRPITISEASQQSFIDTYGFPGTLIPNGVKAPEIDMKECCSIINNYKITPQTKVFLHAGRISRPKNQLSMCKAFKSLIDDGEDVVLLIAGEKQDHEIFSNLESFFNSKRIKYLGTRNDIPKLLAGSDAMLLPSIWEGLPVVLLESLSTGCIPICSPVGGIINVVNDGYNGLLTQNSDSDAISKTIKRFLTMSKDEIKSMRSNCLESFRPYNIEQSAKSYIDAYKYLP